MEIFLAFLVGALVGFLLRIKLERNKNMSENFPTIPFSKIWGGMPVAGNKGYATFNDERFELPGNASGLHGNASGLNGNVEKSELDH